MLKLCGQSIRHTACSPQTHCSLIHRMDLPRVAASRMQGQSKAPLPVTVQCPGSRLTVQGTGTDLGVTPARQLPLDLLGVVLEHRQVQLPSLPQHLLDRACIGVCEWVSDPSALWHRLEGRVRERHRARAREREVSAWNLPKWYSSCACPHGACCRASREPWASGVRPGSRSLLVSTCSSHHMLSGSAIADGRGLTEEMLGVGPYRTSGSR